MSVEIDAIGNLIGHYEGGRAGAKTLLLGSHLDTVRNAGRYDGILGVMIVVACLAGFIPAQRASRIDPILALRYE